MADIKTPYWLTLALAADRLGAAVLFNRPDLTISTLCWMVRTHDAVQALPRNTMATPDQRAACAALFYVNPYGWQVALLRGMGAALEWMQPGHCAKARKDDLALLQRTVALLTPKEPRA